MNLYAVNNFEFHFPCAFNIFPQRFTTKTISKPNIAIYIDHKPNDRINNEKRQKLELFKKKKPIYMPITQTIRKITGSPQIWGQFITSLSGHASLAFIRFVSTHV